jgi:glycosyltransferase involved in cell wall biosynthesis
VNVRRSLNVAFLTSARAWRGSGVSLSNIAHGLVERGHQPYMLAGEDAVVQAFAQRGLSATRVPTADTGLAGTRALVRALRVIKADCIVVDRPRDLRLAALASLVYPLAIVNRYNLSRPTPPRDLLSRLAYLRVRLTIFISETSARGAWGTARYLRRRPHCVIPGGVGTEFQPDPGQASTFRARYGLGDREFVLAVGSLTADKRYEFLFEALRLLGPEAPLFVVCGQGPLAEKLQQQAAALGLEVRFLGMVSPEVLVGAYGAAACLVHACDIETFGLSVLEAMTCGRPIVAVDGGAVPEVLGETGIVTPANDPKAFAARLRELLADPEQRSRLGVAANRRATQHFTVQAMREAYTDAIESVCAADKPRRRTEHVEPPAPRA